MVLRWTCVLGLVVGSTTASARSYRRPAPTVPRHDFWRDVIEPHAFELARLIDLAKQALLIVEEALAGDTGWAAEERQQFVLDAYHLMQYARSLSPHHLEVLALLGRAANEAGKTAEAIEAFEAHTKAAGRDKATLDVIARLGGIYLRLGQVDEAITTLRYAQAPQGAQASGYSRDQTHATIFLAHALAARGESAAAIDVLVAATPAMTSYYNHNTSSAMVGFALAVMYDRIEQRGAAFDQLDKLQSTLAQTGTHMYTTHLQDELARIALTPAEDVHYYRALLYESRASYVEARAEWANYAAFPDTMWRARALAHIAAIDARARAPLAANANGILSPPLTPAVPNP